MMNKDDPALGENLIEIVAGDEGWQDVVLPDGALKSGKLDGLIGFQECFHNSVWNFSLEG